MSTQAERLTSDVRTLSPVQSRAKADTRIGWIDVARGIGIILVIAGHAAGGIIDGPGGQSMPWLRYAFLALYTFHMPVFFFLAGLFVVERLERGTAAFLKAILITIVYPYFLWSIIQFSLIYASGSLVNHPVETYWATIIALPWRTVSQFWFLHALFLVHLLGLAAWRTGGRAAVLVAAVAVKLIAMFVPSTPALSLAAGNAPYYALGLAIGWQKASAIFDTMSDRLRIGTGLCAVLAIILLCSEADQLQHMLRVETASSSGIARIAWMPAMLPATLLGGATLLIIASALAQSGGRISQLLERIGKLSMPIFLVHILFIAGTRIVATHIFHIAGAPLLPLLVVIGVGGPLLVKAATDRIGASKSLGLR